MAQIIGQVDSSGLPTLGTSMFSAGRPSTGNYTVTYEKSFSSEPIVVVTVLGDGSQADAVCVSDSKSGGFAVTIKSPNGDYKNRGFNFVATDETS